MRAPAPPVNRSRRTLALIAVAIGALGGGFKVQYEAAGLGQRKRGTVTSWRMDMPSEVNAKMSFEGGRVGGKTGFAATAGKNERMVDKPPLAVNADDVYNAVFTIDNEEVGNFVLVRKGRRVFHLGTNGFILDDIALAKIINDRIAAFRSLDTP